MNGHGFFNLILILSFLLSNLGGITTNQTSNETPGISWNIKGNVETLLDRIDSWLGGLRTNTFIIKEYTPVGNFPTTTPTPGFGIAPTADPTRTVVPTSSPTLMPTDSLAPTLAPTQTLTPTLTATPEQGFLLASLEVTLEPDPAAPGDVVTATWTIYNYRGQFDGVEIWLYLPEGFLPMETGGGSFNPETNLLIVPIDSANGLISWFIDGNAQPPYEMLAEVRLNGQVIMSVTRSLSERGPDLVPTGGGEALGFNQRVKVNFPAGALPEDADVSVRAPKNTELSLGGRPMELTATGREDGKEITRFGQPVTITVQYTDEEADRLLKQARMIDETSISLFYYDETENTWIPLPTSVDPVANQFTAITDHFSLVDYKAQNWEAARLPSLDGFQVSGFTGAGTYSYPIQVPPGPGGLQPSLALSYNTQEVDLASSRTQASWVGMGWSLDTGYIQRNMNGTANYFGDDTFSLVMNGVGGLLLPIADQDGDGDCTNNGCTIDYHFANENYWRVRQYLKTGDVGGYQADQSKWVVFAPDGTQYYFGNYGSAPNETYDGHAFYQSYPSGCGSVFRQTWRWSLTRIRNIYGKELTYTYNYDNLPKYGISCPGSQGYMAMAVYPESIIYPNSRYRIVFTRDLNPDGSGKRTDFDSDWITPGNYASTILFMQSNLKQIEVWHDPDGNWASGDKILIRKYVLGYGENGQQIYPGVTWPGWTGNNGKTLTLTSITEYGLNGTNPLPATTFKYWPMHFKSMENGYGGKLEYFIDNWHADNGYESYLFSPDVVYNKTYEWYPDEENDNELDYLKQYFQPGTYYKISARVRQAAGSSVQLGLDEGGGIKVYGSAINLNPGQWTTVTSYVSISGAASQARALMKCNATCDLDWYEVFPLVTRYRITQKTITDQVTNSTYTTLYSYEGGAVNDSTHSTYVETDPSGIHLMTKPNTEFRGHSHVTETDPDGHKVETWYNQDDIYKGQATKTQVTDGSGNIYTESDITYVSQENATYNLPHPEGQPANSDLKIYWVYTTAEENRTYNGDTGYVATRNDYLYDTDYQNGTQYGNRTRIITSSWSGYEWRAYRGSMTVYYPMVSDGTPETSRFLVGLPGYTKAFQWSGGCDWDETDAIGTQWYLYDGHTMHNTPLDNGILTGNRSKIFFTPPPNNEARYADTSYGYDSWGNRTSITQYTGDTGVSDYGTGAGAQTTYTCYGSGVALNYHTCSDDHYYTYPVWELNDKNHQTYFEYDKTKGLPTRMTDPNGAITDATYDEFGRILTIIRPGDDSNNPTARMSYHTNSYPYFENPYWTEAQQRISGSSYFKIRKFYSSIGQLLQTQVVGATIGASTKEILTDTFYDAGGRVYQQTVPYDVATGGIYQPRSTGAAHNETTYDVLGRTKISKATDGATTTYTYWDDYTNEVPFLYTKVTNPQGNYTITKSDIWGRAVLVTPPTGPTVSYTYNAADRLLQTTRGSATTTTLTYDYGGRKTNMSDPDMGAWVYTYDALGNLKTQTDAKGCITTLAYDSLNRLTGKTYSGACSGTAVAYTYDSGSNGKGRRTGMTDGSGSTSWTYDSRGRMTQELRTLTGGTSFKTQWSYNSADLVSSMTYPSNASGGTGEVVNFSYLKQMLVDSVSGTSTYVQHTDYDAAGRVDLRKLGADTLRTDYVYYAWNTQGGRLQYLKTGTPSNATSMQYFTYTYDEIGNVKTIVDAKNSSQKQCFLYDSLDRLTRGTTQLSDAFCQATHVGNGTYDESYTYDASTGNLISKGGQTLSYGDTNHKHATTAWNGWTYTYDANGNMVTRSYGGTTYALTYDAENHMTGMTGGGVSASFVYDGDGNRVKGIVGGITTTYVGNYFEWVSSTSDMKKYYYAGGVRVAMRTGSNNPLWLLGDHSLVPRDRLGSTSKVANFDGLSVHSQQLYKPWGEKRYPTGAPTLPTTFRYTGQRSETGLGPSGGEGLMFYNARWFDPSLARFIQPDSIVPGFIDSQVWDRYIYSYNNPVKYIDPSGHDPCSGKTDVWVPDCEVNKPFSFYAWGITLEGNWDKSAIDEIQKEMEAFGETLSMFANLPPDEAFRATLGNRTIQLNLFPGVGCNSTTPGIIGMSCNSGTSNYLTGSIGTGLISHELSHNLNTRFGGFFTYLLGKMTIKNSDGKFVTGKDPATGNFHRTDLGYKTNTFPDEQHPIYWLPDGPTSSEDWADMLMNYTENNFASDSSGYSRYSWVTVALAIFYGQGPGSRIYP